MSKYDVIIIGASFAGLAVASRISSGKVLLVDQKEIGVGGKSACGTILYKMKELGLEKAVLQIHREIFLHTPLGTLKYQLFSPFCVIDYKKLCLGLFQKGRAQVLLTNVTGFDGKTLMTEKGNFQAKILIDASGWGAVLSKKPEVSIRTSRRRRENLVSRKLEIGFHLRGGPGRTPRVKGDLSSGLETILPYQEKGLHFWYEPKVFPKGIFWLFPQGKVSGFGVGSYQGKTSLKPYLDEFLTRFGLKAGKLHGGYFPHRLRKPVEGKIFRVGDAAGQCLPITGEGIRPAIFFGQKCGEIIEEILLGKITLEQGLKEYQDFVLAKKFPYEIMYLAQRFLTSLPQDLFYPIARLVSKKRVTDFILKHYLSIIEGNFKKGGGKC